MKTIRCKTCDDGVMDAKKKFRLGAVGLVFGLLIGIPSALALLVGGAGLLTIGETAEEVSDDMAAMVRPGLEEAHVPAHIIDAVASDSIPYAELSRLTNEQRSAISAARLGLGTAQFGAGAGVAVAGGMFLFFVLVSPVGLLIAFLLTLRKRILQCRRCGAVVPAS